MISTTGNNVGEAVFSSVLKVTSGLSDLLLSITILCSSIRRVRCTGCYIGQQHCFSAVSYTPIPYIVVRFESNKQEADDRKGLWESPN